MLHFACSRVRFIGCNFVRGRRAEGIAGCQYVLLSPRGQHPGHVNQWSRWQECT
jgi:hypothetical protein